MAKSHIVALIMSQVASLGAKDSKERLQHMVAGVKDGRLYSHAGTDYGQFDGEDIEFITEEDLNLARVTKVKIDSIKKSMEDYFGTYLNGVSAEPAGEVSDEVEEEPKDESKNTEEVEDAPVVSEEDIFAEAKKAIKKGKIAKAEKLIEKMSDKKLIKKLNKKLKEVE